MRSPALVKRHQFLCGAAAPGWFPAIVTAPAARSGADRGELRRGNLEALLGIRKLQDRVVALGAGEPLRLGDVERPVLVHKGDLVTIVLRTASLQLTAQGKALDDGAFNALVRVENAKSHRVIDTAVTGPGLVAVRIPGNGAVPTLAALR